MTPLRDTLDLLAWLTLEGGRVDALRRLRTIAAPDAPGEFGDRARELLSQLASSDLDEVTVEFTRLMVADCAARSPLPVPPWEDCWVGDERTVMGPRSQAALLSYAQAELGFDGIKDHPADHIGLELLFVAALLDEEQRGERDNAARVRFVDEHLRRFCPAIGKALATQARHPVWRAVGETLAALPQELAPRTLHLPIA